MIDRHVTLDVFLLVTQASDLHLPLLHATDDGFLVGTHVHKSCLVVGVALIVDPLEMGI